MNFHELGARTYALRCYSSGQAKVKTFELHTEQSLEDLTAKGNK